MSRPYKPEEIKIAAGGDEPFTQTFRYFRLKKIDGGDSVDVQFGDNGGHYATCAAGRKIEFETELPFLRFKNTSEAEITVTFYALIGVKDADDVFVIDPESPVTIKDGARVEVDTSGGAVAVSVENSGTPIETKVAGVGLGFVQGKTGVLTVATPTTVFTTSDDNFLTGLAIDVEEANDCILEIYTESAVGVKQHTLIRALIKGGQYYSQYVSLPDLFVPDGYKIILNCSSETVDRYSVTVYGKVAL